MRELKPHKVFQVMLFVFLFLGFSTNVFPKSLYVLNMQGSMEAFDIQENVLIHQTSTSILNGGNAVGLALDEDSQYLFVTYESANYINIFNANTMEYITQVLPPNASNLAGVVVDQRTHRVYAVNRNADRLFVYFWDAAALTLTNLITSGSGSLPLTNESGGTIRGTYGLTIDERNNTLYVGYMTYGIMAYNIDHLTNAKIGGVTAISNIATTHDAVDVAIDVDNQYIYSTSASPGGDKVLHKYELNNDDAHSSVDVVFPCVGVAVDQASGLVYTTTYSKGSLGVYNSDLALQNTYMSEQRPTGLVIPTSGSVSFNPLNLTIIAPSVAGQGADINYSISYSNPNSTEVTNVTLIAWAPANTTYVSCSAGGVYESVSGTVTWNIGTIAANARIASKSLIVTAPSSPGIEISMTARINSPDTGWTQITQTATTQTASDNAPVMTNFSGSITYTAGGSAAAIDLGADATVEDTDDDQYNGGFLLADYQTSFIDTDQMTIADAGNITTSGSEVRYNGTAIGDIDSTNNGANGNNLKINFDSNPATDEAIGALIHALRFSNNTTSASGTPTTQRSIDITLKDPSGNSSPASTVTVNLTPTVTTTPASSITATTALSGGNVTADGGAAVTARGVCWNTSANPTTADSKTSDGTGTGSFESSITGLSLGNTYHIRAYAINSNGVSYGSDVEFTTRTASFEFESMDPIILEVGKTAGPDDPDGTKLKSDPEGEGAYTWTSSNEDVATVSTNGTVTAIAYLPEDGKNYGTSWITVTDNDKRQKSKLAKIYDHISVTPVELKGRKVGESDTLTASGATGTYTWESSNSDVATVLNGIVTYRAIGTADMTIMDGETWPAKFDACTVAVSVTQEGTSHLSELELTWDNGETTVTVLAGNTMNIECKGGDENYIWSGSAGAWLNSAKTGIEAPEDAAAGIYELTITDGKGTSKTLSLIVPLKLQPYSLSLLATEEGNDLVFTVSNASGNVRWTIVDSGVMVPGFGLVNKGGDTITNRIKKTDVDIDAVSGTTAWIEVKAHDDNLDAKCDVTTNRINVVLASVLKVRAVDSNGTPINNAFVKVLGAGKAGTMSGTNPVEFTDLPYSSDIRYKVRVSAGGYLTEEEDNLSASGDVYDVILTESSAGFTGAVKVDGSALEGATVIARNNQGRYFYTVTNSAGGFSIDVATEDIANPWKVAVTKQGYTSTSEEGLTLNAGETILVGDLAITRQTVISWAVHKDPDFANNSRWTIKLTSFPDFVDGDESGLIWSYITGAGITNFGCMGDPVFQDATKAICIPYTADIFDDMVSAEFTAEPAGGVAATMIIRFEASGGTDRTAVAEGEISPDFGGSVSLIQSEVEEGDKDNTGFDAPPGGIETDVTLWVRVERTSAAVDIAGYSLSGAVYQLDLVDSSGQVVDSSDKTNQIFLRFRFDPTKWVPYQDAIFYREEGGMWRLFSNNNILNVDYLSNTITIESNRLYEWSLMTPAGGGDESGGPCSGGCFVNTLTFEPVAQKALLLLLFVILVSGAFLYTGKLRTKPWAGNRRRKMFNSTGKNSKTLMIVAISLLITALSSGLFDSALAADSPAGTESPTSIEAGKKTKGDASEYLHGTNRKGEFSARIGMGYNYVHEKVHTTLYSRRSEFGVEFSLYPLLRVDYWLNDRIAIEAGFHLDYYEWYIKNSLTEDDSHFYGYTFVIGPAFYGRERDFGFLGRGALFAQIGIGCKFLNTDLDMPIKDYDPAIGWELAAGFEKGRYDFRIGYGFFKHDADNTASGFSTDGSNSTLNLSGFFFDITYRL